MLTIPQRFYMTLGSLNTFRFLTKGLVSESLHPRPEGRGFQKKKVKMVRFSKIIKRRFLTV